MTSTYSCTYALARLLWSSVFYLQVLIRLTPGLFGEISRFENALVEEYEMATFIRYCFQSVVKSDCFINEFLSSLFLPSWNILDLNLPSFHSSKLHYFDHYSSLDSSVWELAVEHDASTLDAQDCPQLLILLACYKLEF
jgi:hypothetical protein